MTVKILLLHALKEIEVVEEAEVVVVEDFLHETIVMEVLVIEEVEVIPEVEEEALAAEEVETEALRVVSKKRNLLIKALYENTRKLVKNEDHHTS